MLCVSHTVSYFVSEMVDLCGYEFEGPFLTWVDLSTGGGVYFIASKHGDDVYPIDVGEAGNLRDRVKTHDRKDCWEKENVGVIYYYQYLTPVMFERKWNNPSMNAPIDFGDSPETFREQEFLDTWMNRRLIKQDIISTWGPPFLRKDLWEEVGGFCEDYFPGWGTDSDLIASIYYSAIKNNNEYEFRGVSDSGVYHIQSVGLKKINHGDIYQANALNLFRRRWRIDIMDLYTKIGTGSLI